MVIRSMIDSEEVLRLALGGPEFRFLCAIDVEVYKNSNTFDRSEGVGRYFATNV